MSPPDAELICTCMCVPRARVEALLAQDLDLAAVRHATAAGTGCGSCRPALRRLARRARWRRWIRILWR